LEIDPLPCCAVSKWISSAAFAISTPVPCQLHKENPIPKDEDFSQFLGTKVDLVRKNLSAKKAFLAVLSFVSRRTYFTVGKQKA
jgi:hypothetical protein